MNPAVVCAGLNVLISANTDTETAAYRVVVGDMTASEDGTPVQSYRVLHPRKSREAFKGTAKEVAAWILH